MSAPLRARHAVLALAITAVAARSAHADSDAGSPAPTVKLDCPRVSEPGRVRCDIEVRAPAGRVIRWADVAIIRTPLFASALRGRVGPRETSAREDTVWRWSIALAAKDRGEGKLEARVHLVSCVSATSDACEPVEIDASASVVVGG